MSNYNHFTPERASCKYATIALKMMIEQHVGDIYSCEYYKLNNESHNRYIEFPFNLTWNYDGPL